MVEARCVPNGLFVTSPTQTMKLHRHLRAGLLSTLGTSMALRTIGTSRSPGQTLEIKYVAVPYFN